MAAGRRPGGLTALAVLNFVFSGLAVIGILGLVVVVTMAGSLKEAAQTADERATFEALENMNMGLWALILASNALAFATLLISGIGYLKMRHWGRLFANVYAVTAIGTALLGVFLSPAELGGGFNIGTIINLVYPLLTLYFINITFKDDLTS